MKRILPIGAVLAVVAAGSAWGVFVEPTQSQLRAAAETPSRVVPMLQDANVAQAANVGKDVIIEIVQLDLKPEDRKARIQELVGYLFGAMPDQAQALAIALGLKIAASPTASMSPEIVSAIQVAIIAQVGLSAGNGFGNSYTLAMQTVAGAPGGGKTVPPQPPPPPVALPYEGQRLR